MNADERLRLWLDGLTDREKAELVKRLSYRSRAWRWRWTFRVVLGATGLVLWFSGLIEWYLTGQLPSCADFFSGGAVGGISIGALIGHMIDMRLDRIAAKGEWPKPDKQELHSP